MYLNSLHQSFAPEIGDNRPRVLRRRLPSRWLLGDLIPDGETVDVEALLNVPLSTAGSYGEGAVQDALDRLNMLREAWAKKLITDGDYKYVLYPMTPKIIAAVERIARMGSKAASVVNTLWGEIQNQGYIGKDGNQWVHLFPPTWPPKPVQIVFPKPNRSSSLLKKVVTTAAKVLAPATTFATALAVKAVNPKNDAVGKALDLSPTESKILKTSVPVAEGVTAGLAVTAAVKAVQAASAAKAIEASAAAAEQAGYGAAADVAQKAAASKAAEAGYGAAADVAKGASDAATKAAAERAADALSSVKTAVTTANPSEVKSLAEKTSKITDALAKMKTQLKSGSTAEKVKAVTEQVTKAVDAAKQAADKVAEAKQLIDSTRKPATDQFSPFETTPPQPGTPTSFLDQKYAGVPVIILVGLGVLGAGYFFSRRAA